MAQIDESSWRSWTTCATSVGSRYRLGLPAVKLILNVRKDVKPVLFWGLSHFCSSSGTIVNFINSKSAETHEELHFFVVVS